MKKTGRFILISFLMSSVVLSAAVLPHVAFVYPAGALPGSTVTVTVGGQYLKDYAGLNLSGTPVEAQLTDFLRIYDQKEGNALRRRKEIIEAKMAEEPNEKTKQQMQYQIEMLEPEIAMVRETKMEDKMNPALASKKQFNPQIAERITLEFTLPANIKPGEHELRVITTNGLSNPLIFLVGQIPETSEAEPNDTVTAPEQLPSLPVLVNGQIMPGDVDCFKFSAKEGQKLVIRADARSLIPYLADTVPGWFQAVLTLYDANGIEVAYDDDFRFDPDPVLMYTVPKDGDYTLSIRDSIFRGREDFVYRISIGELPFIERIFPLGGTVNSEVDVNLAGVNLPVRKMKIKTGSNAPDTQTIRVEKNGVFSNVRNFNISPLPSGFEIEPNNQASQAQVITNALVVDGTIGNPGDQDWFCFHGRQGEEKSIEVFARRLDSPLDARLVLLDAQQKELAVNDDITDKGCGLLTHAADSRINFKLPETGTYFVRLSDLQGKGGEEYAYRLMIGEAQPDFQLRIVPASLRVPRDGTAIATVHAIRYGGFTGEIRLSVVDAPLGVELQRAVIPAGADSTRIVIAAKTRAQDQMMSLEIEGVADCGPRIVHRRAVPAEDMMQAFIYRHLVIAQKFLVQITDPVAVTVSLGLPKDGVFRARPGSEITLNAAVKWRDSSKRGIKLVLAEPPEWLTLKTTFLSGQGDEVILSVSPNAEPGNTATVLLNGSVRIEKSAKDPDYDPVLKFKNGRSIDFTIDAISIEIIN
jgi:hypothetical protein